jgi:glycerol-3-phosphate dehydrogenase
MIFAIPRGKITYVGTTDTNYNLDKDMVETDIADAIYLIAAVNNMFPRINLEMEDIQSSWAGLRPLIHEEGKSASELSRKDEIFTSETGLISIAGGKLTGYRKMAERTVNRIVKKMEEEEGKEVPDCLTETLTLCGSAFKKHKEVKIYIAEIYERIKADGFTVYDAWYLVTNYGVQTEAIINFYKNRKEKDKAVRMILSEVEFGVAFEMVQSPMDFFIRRTGRLYFDIQSVRTFMKPVILELQRIFKANEEKAQEWKEALKSELKAHSDFSMERT